MGFKSLTGVARSRLSTRRARVNGATSPKAESEQDDGVGRTCFVLALSGRDDDFIRHGALVTLRSLHATNPDVPVVVLYDDLSSAQRLLLQGHDLRQFDVSGFRRSSSAVAARPDLDNSVFLRFGIEDLLDFDTALYLDCDTVVLDEIDSIFEIPGEIVGTPMSDHPLEGHFRDGAHLLASEQIHGEHFAVNAGVLKFDLRYWRETGLRDAVLGLARAHGWDSFLYCDQSIINLVGYRTDTLRYMSKLYNFMWWPHMNERRHTVGENESGLAAPITEDGAAKVVHWTGPIKPWQPSFRALSKSDQELYCGRCYSQFCE